jgi:hypothetical protein
VATAFVGVTQPKAHHAWHFTHEWRAAAASDGGDQFHLSHPKFDESGGLAANGVVVEHERHVAVPGFRRDEFQHAVLSGGDAMIILNWRAGRDWHVFEPAAKE